MNVNVAEKVSENVQSVEEAIISMVVEKMGTDEKLPTEKQMVETFGISRTTLREIFSVLEANGMVESYQGKGRYAVMPDMGRQIVNSWALLLRAKPEMVLNFLEIRRLLEVNSLERAMQRADLEMLTKLSIQVEKMKERASQGKSFSKEDREFHRILFMSTQNILLEQLLTAFWDIYDQVGIEREHEDLMKVALTHEEIHNAFIKQDLALATKLMEEQFVDARYRIVQFLATR